MKKIDDETFLKIRSLCKYYHMSNDRNSDTGWEHSCHCKENITTSDSWITCSLENCKIFQDEEANENNKIKVKCIKCNKEIEIDNNILFIENELKCSNCMFNIFKITKS